MTDAVTIEEEQHYRSRWIKVYIPQHQQQLCSASLQNKQGVLLRRISLNTGYNAIDISHITDTPISIKVETPWETILKEI
jgi:hypothetical protein